MNMRNYIVFALVAWLGLAAPAFSQELQCVVNVSAPTVSSDQSVYPQMQDAIMKYVNFRKWTDLKFEPQERIKCKMLLMIKERPAADHFIATLQVQLIRPVYNSSYETMVLNLFDNDINFKFVAFTPLEFSENNYIDELTSLLNYYCYMIIGFDAETFELGSGTPHFQKAQTIVNLAGAAPNAVNGWKNYDGTRNRYWLANEVLDNTLKQFHNVLYVYYRQGLDQMEKNSATGRAAIVGALKEMQKINQRYPAKYITRVFITAKQNEIIDLFRNGNMTEKADVIRIMSELDPANASDYEKIKEEK
jgi:hypothetical protein